MNPPINDLLTDSFLAENLVSRRNLVPLWIKIFAWIFLVTGFMTPVVFMLGLVSHGMSLSIYHLSADTPLSLMGVSITGIFIFKGIVAWGIIKREHWAVTLAKADAILGIAICTLVWIYSTIALNNLTLPLELVALIPYLVKMNRIKDQWEMAQKD